MLRPRPPIIPALAIRGIGFVLLLTSWACLRITWLTHASPVGAITVLLAAGGFLAATSGSAMVVLGPRLGDPVEVSERWQKRL